MDRFCSNLAHILSVTYRQGLNTKFERDSEYIKWRLFEILGHTFMGTWSEHGPMSFKLRTPIYV